MAFKKIAEGYRIAPTLLSGKQSNLIFASDLTTVTGNGRPKRTLALLTHSKIEEII